MSAQWFLSRGGRNFGPYPAAQLQHMARTGQLLPHDQVLPVGGSQWMAAAAVPGLFGPAAAVSPAMAPRAPVMYASPPAPTGPAIQAEDDTPFERMHADAQRTAFLESSRLIMVPSMLLKGLHLLLAVGIGLLTLAAIVTFRERLRPTFYLFVALAAGLQFAQIRIIDQVSKGSRAAIAALGLFLAMHVAVGAALLQVPEAEWPVEQFSPWLAACIPWAIAGLLQLPIVVGAIRAWRSFE